MLNILPLSSRIYDNLQDNLAITNTTEEENIKMIIAKLKVILHRYRYKSNFYIEKWSNYQTRFSFLHNQSPYSVFSVLYTTTTERFINDSYKRYSSFYESYL